MAFVLSSARIHSSELSRRCGQDPDKYQVCIKDAETDAVLWVAEATNEKKLLKLANAELDRLKKKE